MRRKDLIRKKKNTLDKKRKNRSEKPFVVFELNKFFFGRRFLLIFFPRGSCLFSFFLTLFYSLFLPTKKEANVSGLWRKTSSIISLFPFLFLSLPLSLSFSFSLALSLFLLTQKQSLNRSTCLHPRRGCTFNRKSISTGREELGSVWQQQKLELSKLHFDGGKEDYWDVDSFFNMIFSWPQKWTPISYSATSTQFARLFFNFSSGEKQFRLSAGILLQEAASNKKES